MDDFQKEFSPIQVEFAKLGRSKLNLILENTSPPKILISQKILEVFSPKEIKALMGAFYYLVAENIHLAVKLAPSEIESIFIFLAAIFYDHILIQGIKPQDMEAIVYKVNKSLPRKIRQEIEPLIAEFWLNREHYSPSEYFREIHSLSQKFGILFSQSLEAYLQAILRVHLGGEEPTLLSKEEITHLLQNLPSIQEILFFTYTFPWDNMFKPAK